MIKMKNPISIGYGLGLEPTHMLKLIVVDIHDDHAHLDGVRCLMDGMKWVL